MNKQEKFSQEKLEHCHKTLGAIQDALYVLNGKWKLPIIIALGEGNTRFGEIQRSIGKIAPKVLSHELKELELNGLIVRRVNDTFPATVEYELTGYQRSLEKVMQALSEWGMKHREKIREDSRKGGKAAI